MSFFAAGVVASYGAELSVSTGVILVCAGMASLLVRRKPGWLVLAFSCGAAIYAARYAVLNETDVRLILEKKPALVKVRGRLIETPSLREYPGRTNAAAYAFARVAVTELWIEKAWRPARGQIACSTRGALTGDFFKGRAVELDGVLAPPNGAPAPGVFDFRRYLYHQRVFYQLRCESTNDWRLLSFEALPITERFQRWAHRQLGRGLDREDETLGMLRAMALGTNQSLAGEVADAFMRTGTMHIVAISGLHVACIAGSILFLLRIFGVPRDRTALILIPLIWFYTVATGWQSSAVRSALMATFAFGGWALRRPADLLNSTAGAGLLILLFEPEQLFQASFQLSFLVVAAIALILGPGESSESWIIRLRDQILRYDPLLPEELRPEWKKRLERPVMMVLSNFAVSAASWIGSNPLTAYYFNLVTPVSLVANLVAVPLSSIALASSLGSLLIPPLGVVFNYISWLTMHLTIVVTRWLAGFSWGYFYVPKPNIWFFAAYFAILAVCVLPALRKRTIYAGVALALAALLWSGIAAGRNARITVLAATGTPKFIDEPGQGNDLLVDCSNARTAEQLLKRYLHGQGIGTLPNLLLTQGRVDFIGGFELVDREFVPKRIFASFARGRSRPYRALLERLEATPRARRTIGQTVGWQVLHPLPGEAFSKAEENGVVLKKNLFGWEVLLAGHAGPRAQEKLIESGIDLRCEILIAGDDVLPEFVQRAAPRLLIIESYRQPFGQPKRERRPEILCVPGMIALETLRDGTVTLELDGKECRVQATARSAFAILKHHE